MPNKTFTCVALWLALALGAMAAPGRWEQEMTLTPDTGENCILLSGIFHKGVPFLSDVQMLEYTDYPTRRAHRSESCPAEVWVEGQGKVPTNMALPIQDSQGQTHWEKYLNAGRKFSELRLGLPGEVPKRVDLGCASTQAPRLRIQVDEKGQLEWSMDKACRVNVAFSINDGEVWQTLDSTPQGRHNYAAVAKALPVYRFQVFQGVTPYHAYFDPSCGFLDERSYLIKSYWNEELCLGGGHPFTDLFTAYFESGAFGGKRVNGEDVPPVSLRVKINLDRRRLPFDPAKLFPGRRILKVFQMETPGVPQSNGDFDYQDPWVYPFVSKSGAKLCSIQCEGAKYTIKSEITSKSGSVFVGCIKKGSAVTFDTYWVLHQEE